MLSGSSSCAPMTGLKPMRYRSDRIDHGQGVGVAHVLLCLRHVCIRGMADAQRLELMCAHDRIEAHAVQIVGLLAVPELLQLERVATRQLHGNAVLEWMGHDNKVL